MEPSVGFEEVGASRELGVFVDTSIDVWNGIAEAGGMLLCGTDVGAIMVFPGLSVHEELELLVREVGLTPAQALCAATLAPAIYSKMDSEWGRIEVGKRADMVLLRKNPLDDIQNSRNIEWVIFQGRRLNRDALKKLAAEAKVVVDKLR